jgi:beta-glucanase (GH16 family)
MLLGLISAAFAAPPPGYTLVWSDEFNGTALDTNNWSYDTGGNWPSGQQQFYTNGLNMSFENGSAILWAKKQTYGLSAYTSCYITTQGKREFKYGYIEVRLKGPCGRGPWPFFSLWGKNYPWPECGAIELYDQMTGPQNFITDPGDSGYVAGCYFKGASNPQVFESAVHKYTDRLSNDYHLYAIEWDSLGIKYSFDGNQFLEYDTINASYNSSTFHQPYFLNANLVVYGYITDTTIFPQKMYIDYVRVYQKSTQTVANPPKRMNITLPNPSAAQLRVYNLQGRLMGDYTDMVRRLKPGENAMKEIASNLPIGTYVIRLLDGVKTVSEKLAVSR